MGLWAVMYNELRVRDGVPVRRGRSGEAGQARPVRQSCAGRAGCQAGKVARQARPVRPSCAGGWVPGRQSHLAGEAGRPPCGGVRRSGHHMHS